MKKLFSLLLALLFCLSFASCNKDEPSSTTPLGATTGARLETTEAPKPTDSTTASPTPQNPNAPKSAVTQAIVRVDITEDTKFDAILEKEKEPPASDFDQDKSLVNVGYALGEVYLVLAENDDTFILSDKKHLPVYKCASVDELESFRLNLGSTFELTRSYDGFPSFAEVTEGLGEDFFEENVLLLVYVEATSGSYRFGVRHVEVKDGAVTVHIEQTNDPPILTCDMAGWLLMTVVEKDRLTDGPRFDAIMN